MNSHISHNCRKKKLIFLRTKTGTKHENVRETEHLREKSRENRVYIKKISKKPLTTVRIYGIIILVTAQEMRISGCFTLVR